MITVDLRKRSSRVSTKYIDVPQPMTSYTSTSELFEHQGELGLPPQSNVLMGKEEFVSWLKSNDFIGKNTFIDVIKMNIWIATNEVYIPDTWSPDDKIIYRLDDGMKLIPTDNCYVRLYKFYSGTKGFLLLTSSGMYNISFVKWDLSAATKLVFDGVSNSVGITRKKPNYDKAMEAILTRKKYLFTDMQLFNLIFNPYSDYYLKGEAAVVKVYGAKIKPADRMRILQSDRFLKLIRQELSKMIPNLSEAIKNQIPPAKFAKFLEDVFVIAKDKGTTNDQLTALDAILNLGYPEEKNIPNANQANTPLIKAGLKAVLGGDESRKILTSGTKGTVELNIFDDTEDAAQIFDLNTEKGRQDFSKAKEETGAISGYTQPE